MKLKLCYLLLMCHIANAMIATTPPFLVLSEQVKQVNLKISNSDSHRAYIEMQANEKKCMNKDCSQYKELDTDLAKRIKFSNERFILDPGQKRGVIAFWEEGFPEKTTTFLIGGHDHAAEAVKSSTSKYGKSSLTMKYRVAQTMKVVVLPANTKSLPPLITNTAGGITIENSGSAPLFLRVKAKCGGKTCLDKNEKSLEKQFPKTVAGNTKVAINAPAAADLKISYYDIFKQTYQLLFTSGDGVVSAQQDLDEYIEPGY